MTEQGFKAAFVFELPEHVWQLLHTASQAEEMDISEHLAQAKSYNEKQPAWVCTDYSSH